MKVGTVDQKCRLRLPGAEPGECFAIRQVDAGHYELSKVVPLPRSPKPTAKQLEQSFKSHALTPRMSWEALRAETRLS